MARDDYQQTQSKEFGESLQYDPTFKGPLHKRSCTDVICLLLFFCFLAGWIIVGIFAFKYGDPVKLVMPTDSDGRRCGLDDEVRSKPYLFFFDLMKCGAQDAIINGCPTPQVCVESCPEENFLLDTMKLNSVVEWRNKMKCKYDVNIGKIQSYEEADKLATDTRCARYYLQSEQVQRRCIPLGDIDAKFVINTLVSGGFELLLGIVGNFTDDQKYREWFVHIRYNGVVIYGRCLPGDLSSTSQEIIQFLNGSERTLNDVLKGVAGINILAEAKEMGHKIVQDLGDSWPFVVGGLVLAMLLCFIYILLMRWFAGLMVWFSLLGVIALLSYCCYASYVKYDEMKTAEDNANLAVTQRSRNLKLTFLEPAKEQIDQILQMKDTWLAFLIISSILLVIVLLLVIFLRNRIRVAIALIKEASKAVSSVTSTLVFPLFPWFLQIFVIGWFVTVLLFLAGSSKPMYKALMNDSYTCKLSNITYKNGDHCNPDTFDSSSCPDAVCQFFNYEKYKYVDYLHAYNIFGAFWGLFFVSALGEMILAATFATWYWTFNKSDVPFLTLTVSIARTFRYHLGTLAFGSLILAICRVIRVILEYINHKLKKYDNAFVKAIMCCLRCFFWCLEKFIKFINRNAYIMCAIHGKNFCRSAKDAFNLLMRNVVRVFVLDKVTDFLLFLGKLMITAGMVALSFFVFTKELKYDKFVEVPSLNYSIVPVLIIGFGTYFIANIFFGVYAMAVDTLFLCFLEDCERNDGTKEKPYFMSKELMKILHKKNK